MVEGTGTGPDRYLEAMVTGCVMKALGFRVTLSVLNPELVHLKRRDSKG
jgi:hypothetical protein